LSLYFLALSEEGFLARDIAFENKPRLKTHQVVALRVNANFIAFYRCVMYGYQNTLYVHSFRQFYRKCDIFGTIDTYFTNATMILQAGNIVSKIKGWVMRSWKIEDAWLMILDFDVKNNFKRKKTSLSILVIGTTDIESDIFYVGWQSPAIESDFLLQT